MQSRHGVLNSHISRFFVKQILHGEGCTCCWNEVLCAGVGKEVDPIFGIETAARKIGGKVIIVDILAISFEMILICLCLVFRIMLPLPVPTASVRICFRKIDLMSTLTTRHIFHCCRYFHRQGLSTDPNE